MVQLDPKVPTYSLVLEYFLILRSTLTHQDMTESPIRLVVADGQPVFVLGVRALLADDATVQIVGEAADGEEALRLVECHRPDVLLSIWRWRASTASRC